MTLKTSAGRLAFFALAIIAATSLLSGNARACSIMGYKKPSKVQIESEARRLYRQSDYIAEVTVVKVPKYNRDNSVIAGSARVDAVIKGSPSKILKIPPPGPCGNQYGVGDRLIVFFKNGKEMHPSSYEVVGAIQRLKLGNWRKARGPVFRVGPFKI